MKLSLFKSFVYRLLCNSISGTIVTTVFSKTIPDIRWPRFRFVIPRQAVNKKIMASVFWGFYESAEIRFIERYFDGNTDVIEFGGSIGIVSSHIASKLKPGKKLLTIEANPFLIETIRRNVSRYIALGAEYRLFNKAVGYHSPCVSLHITDNNTETRIGDDLADGSQTIPTCRLSDIIAQEQISNYTLVCDIEGSEAEVFENDKDSLQRCRQLFVELHDTAYNGKHYTVDSLLNILINEHGFRLRAHYRPVFLLEK